MKMDVREVRSEEPEREELEMLGVDSGGQF